MLRRCVWLFSLLISINSFSHTPLFPENDDATLIAIGELILKIENVIEKAGESAPQCEASFTTNVDESEKANFKELICQFDSARKLCDASSDICTKKASFQFREAMVFGKACAYPVCNVGEDFLGDTATVEDCEKISEKLELNAEKQALILKFTQEKFLEYKESLSEVCCVGSTYSNCSIDFKNTELLVSLDGDVNSQYLPEEKQVILAQENLFYCATGECIEKTLFHELGHACQFSRLSPGESKAMFGGTVTNDDNYFFGKNGVFTYTVGDQRSDLELFEERSGQSGSCAVTGNKGFSEIENFYGSEISQCIEKMEGLLYRQHVIENGTSACRKGLRMELLAELVFMSQKTNLIHFANTCTLLGDNKHPANRPYLKCFFKKDYHEALCGEG